MNDVNKLSSYLKQINRSEAESLQRNREFLSDVSKITDQAHFLQDKTNRLKQIRNEYEDYVCRAYPKWKSSFEESVPSSQELTDSPVNWKTNGSKQYTTSSSRHNEEDVSIYPEFLQKKMAEWKHDTSLNLPEHEQSFSKCHVNHTPGPFVSPDFKERFRLLEENYQHGQLQLQDLANSLQYQDNFTPIRSRKGGNVSTKKEAAENNNRYLGGVENYIPKNTGSFRPKIPEHGDILPVAAEMLRHQPSNGHMRNDTSLPLNSPRDQNNTSMHSNNDYNDIKILPQLLGVKPNGELILLPMTASFNSNSSFHQQTNFQDPSHFASRHSPVGESSVNLENNTAFNIHTNIDSYNEPQKSSSSGLKLDGNQKSNALSDLAVQSPSRENQIPINHPDKTEQMHRKHSDKTKCKQTVIHVKNSDLRVPEVNKDENEDYVNNNHTHSNRMKEKVHKPVSKNSNVVEDEVTVLKSHNVQNCVSNSLDAVLQEPDGVTVQELGTIPSNNHDRTNSHKDRKQSNVRNKSETSNILSHTIDSKVSEKSLSDHKDVGNGFTEFDNVIEQSFSEHENVDSVSDIESNQVIHDRERDPPMSPEEAVMGGASKPSLQFIQSNHDNVNESNNTLHNGKEKNIGDDLNDKKLGEESFFSGFSDTESDFDLPSNENVIQPNSSEVNEQDALILNNTEYDAFPGIANTGKIENVVEPNIVEDQDTKFLNTDHDVVSNIAYAGEGDNVVQSTANEVIQHGGELESIEHENLEKASASSVRRKRSVDFYEEDDYDVDDDYDEPTLLFLLDYILDKISSREEMLVIDMDVDLNVVHTIVGSAELNGNLSKFTASDVCMAFRYHLEQTMLKNAQVPFLEGALDVHNDFEGHLRDCVSPRYLGVWDSLFALISTMMNLSEYEPVQIATYFGFALAPANGEMTEQLRVSLINILSATVSVIEDMHADSNHNYIDNRNPNGEKMIENFSITEEFSNKDDNSEHEIEAIQVDALSSKINNSPGGDPMSKTISFDDTTESGNAADEPALKPYSLDIGSVSEDKDDTASTMSFDSEGMPVPKSKSSSRVKSKDGVENTNTDDFESNEDGLSKSSSAYMKMRQESLISPAHEDSDDLDDLLGESIGLTKENKKKSRPKKPNQQSISTSFVANVASSTLKSTVSAKTDKSSDKAESSSNVLSPRESVSSSPVKLKKPGFWEYSDSDSEVDLNEINKAMNKQEPENDDDFDFDFYD